MLVHFERAEIEARQGRIETTDPNLPGDLILLTEDENAGTFLEDVFGVSRKSASAAGSSISFIYEVNDDFAPTQSLKTDTRERACADNIISSVLERGGSVAFFYDYANGERAASVYIPHQDVCVF